MSRRILVIGGTGFIGSPLVAELQRYGQVTTVARKARPTPGSFVEVNRKDHHRFRRLFEGHRFDVIFDLAAFTDRHVAQIIDLFGGSDPLYIFVSSASVYGIPDGEIDEDAPLRPVTWHDYGKNKLLAERELLQHRELSSVIVRPGVVYGPGDTSKPRAHYFFHRMLHHVPLLIPGKPEIRNNYIYIDDLVQLLLHCLEQPVRIVNAGGKETFDWRIYIHILAQVMGEKLPPMRFLGMDIGQFRHWPHARELEFSHNAFYDFVIETKHQLKWRPQTGLEQGLRRTWKWLQQHEMQQLSTAGSTFAHERQLYRTAGEHR